MQKALDNGGKITGTSELWVNKDNLPVKVTAEVSGADGATGNVTGTYSDWGKPVNITALPAGQVAKMPTLGG